MWTEWLEVLRGRRGLHAVGWVGLRLRKRVRPPKKRAMRDFAIALALLGAVVAALARVAFEDWRLGAGWAGYAVLYFGAALFVHPRPDSENTGWGGTLLDHPLRVTDDFNRALGFWYLALSPGRFVMESIVVFARWDSLPTLDEIVAENEVDPDFFE
jgi:hypothetical protein